jgi:hypothetical protein
MKQENLLDYEDITSAVTEIIKPKTEFNMYFEKKAINSYYVSTIEDKAEVIYDLCLTGGAYSDDGKSIIIKSNINDYGTYAIDNILSESDMWKDKEEINDDI